MDITNAEFDLETGAPIVPGKIALTAKADPSFEIDPHEHLLLRFDPIGTDKPKLAIWPITSSERTETGFRKTSLGCPILFISLSKYDLYKLNLYGKNGKTSFSRSGFHSGEIATSNSPELGNRYGTITHYLSGFHIEVLQTPDGLHVRIAGSVVSEKVLNVMLSGEGQKSGVTIDMTIPWEQMSLMGFGTPYYMRPDAERLQVKVLDKPQISTNLHDLMVSDGLAWPTVPGYIKMDPPDRHPLWRLRDSQYLTLQEFSPESQRFTMRDDASVEVQTNGFVHATRSSYSLHFSIIGGPELEKLSGPDSFHLSLLGDGIGSIIYRAGYGWKDSDREARIVQQIKSLTFHAELSALGLKIHAKGELRGFEADVLEKHEQEGKREWIPGKEFTFKATIPWPLLILRGFSFARKKAGRFIGDDQELV